MPPTEHAQAAAPRPDPLALFATLLRGNSQRALELLAGPGAELFTHKGPGGLTTLHAAAGRCSGAVLEQLAAAGVPVDTRLTESARGGCSLGRFLRQVGCASEEVCELLCVAATPLSVAARAQNAEAVVQLLALGADCFSRHLSRRHDSYALADSVLTHYAGTPAGSAFLVYLERQRANGSLQLDTHRALHLLVAAVEGGHQALAAASLAALAGCISAQREADATLLWRALQAAASYDSGDAPGMLRLLLGSRLPFDLAASGRSALARAALGDAPAVIVPRLHAAGAPLSLADVLLAAQQGSADGLAALLACGRPAADTSRAVAWLGGRRTHACPMRCTYACPIHCVLHKMASMDRAPTPQQHAAALRTLEVLLAAGYRPTVWHDVQAPPFLPTEAFPADGEGQGAVLPRLDPFDYYPAGALSERLAFAARGGAWSPATHRHWPPAFKAATRTLLLAAARDGSRGGGARACPLAALPPDVVLHVLGLAAAPMSAWAGSGEAER